MYATFLSSIRKYGSILLFERQLGNPTKIWLNLVNQVKIIPTDGVLLSRFLVKVLISNTNITIWTVPLKWATTVLALLPGVQPNGKTLQVLKNSLDLTNSFWSRPIHFGHDQFILVTTISFWS